MTNSCLDSVFHPASLHCFPHCLALCSCWCCSCSCAGLSRPALGCNPCTISCMACASLHCGLVVLLLAFPYHGRWGLRRNLRLLQQLFKLSGAFWQPNDPLGFLRPCRLCMFVCSVVGATAAAYTSKCWLVGRVFAWQCLVRALPVPFASSPCNPVSESVLRTPSLAVPWLTVTAW